MAETVTRMLGKASQAEVEEVGSRCVHRWQRSLSGDSAHRMNRTVQGPVQGGGCMLCRAANIIAPCWAKPPRWKMRR